MEDAVVTDDEKNDEYSLASDIEPPKNILEIEGGDRMGNGIEEREIEGVDSETEGVDSDNEVVENEVIPSERKWYRIRTPPQMSNTVTKEPLGAPWDEII